MSTTPKPTPVDDCRAGPNLPSGPRPRVRVTEVSPVFAASGLVEVVLLYPAGSLMDRRGRVWVALPVTVSLGLGLVVLPLTASLLAVGAVSLVMAVGNGLGSGIVMTLGADAGPPVGRAPFLGLWRLLSLEGHNGAALVVGAAAAVASLGAAGVVVGLLTLGGGAWLLRWRPRTTRGSGRTREPPRPTTGTPAAEAGSPDGADT
jgi:MFS family permease